MLMHVINFHFRMTNLGNFDLFQSLLNTRTCLKLIANNAVHIIFNYGHYIVDVSNTAKNYLKRSFKIIIKGPN